MTYRPMQLQLTPQPPLQLLLTLYVIQCVPIKLQLPQLLPRQRCRKLRGLLRVAEPDRDTNFPAESGPVLDECVEGVIVVVTLGDECLCKIGGRC
jgi:hypothetical protein